jgi:hypothetical protein
MKCLETDGVNAVDFGLYDSSEYTNALSIMCWIRIKDAIPSSSRFFGRSSGFNVGTDESGHIRGYVKRTGQTYTSAVSDKILSFEAWTHIAISFYNDDMMLYVNGYGPYTYSWGDNKNDIEQTTASYLSLGGLISVDGVTITSQCKFRIRDLSL